MPENDVSPERATLDSLGGLLSLSQIIQAVLTSAAILGAGYWFVARDIGSTRMHIADIETSIHCISTSLILLNARIRIENVGDVPIKLQSSRFGVNEVLPGSKNFFLEPAGQPGDIHWPAISSFVRNFKKLTITPNESHFEEVDYLISSKYTLVELTAAFTESDLTKPNPTGWSRSHLVDMETIKCE